MKSLKETYAIPNEQLLRIEALCDGYRQFFEDPANATPKIIVHTPAENAPTWEEMLADPLVMLESQLKTVARHLAVEDDYVPAVRVNFGTAQVAAAFGCGIVIPENNPPAACSHPLQRLEDIHTLEMPSLDAALFPKLRAWTEIWLEHLPEGVRFQQPDIQSPFNTAHLVRGNEILTDFFDDPDALDVLLTKVADYMIDLVPVLNRQIGNTTGWFADWGMLWKGAGRLSNCTSDLIGPDLYERHVLPQDLRVLESMGGGRMHCCGGATEVIRTFASRCRITGLDFDSGIHDPYEICRVAAPELAVLLENYGHPFPLTDRLLAGDWPEKRNIAVVTQAPGIPEARELVKKLRASVP